MVVSEPSTPMLEDGRSEADISTGNNKTAKLMPISLCLKLEEPNCNRIGDPHGSTIRTKRFTDEGDGDT